MNAGAVGYRAASGIYGSGYGGVPASVPGRKLYAFYRAAERVPGRNAGGAAPIPRTGLSVFGIRAFRDLFPQRPQTDRNGSPLLWAG